ncbi:MAG: hypothetical protein WBW32_19640, partial [Luteibacter sp.]
MNPAIGLAWNPAVGIPMLFVGVVVLVLIWLFGQPRKEQGRRKPVPEQPEPRRERREPVFGGEEPVSDDSLSFSARDNERFENDGFNDRFDARDERADSRDEDANDPLFRPSPKQGELDVDLRAELERLGASMSGDRKQAAPAIEPDEPAPRPGQRTEPRIDLDLPFELDEP